MVWQMVTALAAVCAASVGFLSWALRSLIREELKPVWQGMGRQAEDIAVLRTAVFNHLAHQQQPVEAHIREVLGYGER